MENRRMLSANSGPDLENPISVGRTAEVYIWKPGWVVKLYFDWFEKEGVEYEHRIASAIHAAGLDVPAVGGIVKVEGRDGLLYEHCEGEAMSNYLLSHPLEIVTYARALANLHARMHAAPVHPNIPTTRSKLEHKIKKASPLPEDLRSAALEALKSMPDGDRICHGDFHPGNVLLSSPEPVIIDWIDASIGSPMADVARTSILALGSAATASNLIVRVGLQILHATYLRRYFQLHPGRLDEYERWLPLVAAGRMSEGIVELEGWLMSEAKKIINHH
jgi:uncharacterized protein (TIGR02172 family)